MEPLTTLELSAKITKSVCMDLEAKGVAVGNYLEQADLLAYKAFDSEAWIKADQVELFLDLVSRDFLDFCPKEVALKALDIRGWGLLDQVLRILQSPSEIFEYPEKFLSYFVRPDLNFSWIKRSKKLSKFKVSLSSDEMPLVTDYLAGALEVVSKYVGVEVSLVNWAETFVSIDWSKKQDSFFEEKKEPLNFKPEIYKEAVKIIQRQQSEILDLKYKAKNLKSVNIDIEKIIQDVEILNDYFLRSYQLIVLLRAEFDQKKWFKEAIKKLNWHQLKGLHNKKVEDIKNKLTSPTILPTTLPPPLYKGEQIGLSLDH